MKVYIITSGEYSDYHIDAVCETLEEAQRKCLRLCSKYCYWWDPYSIEEWDTETGYNSEAEGKYYHVWWDGGKLTCQESDAAECTIRASSANELQRHRDFEFDIDGLAAKDEAHALKIASDMLAEYRALLEGV